MASSITILGFFFFAILILELQFPTWALVLVSLTNDLSVMATSFDKVHSSERPNVWNMTKCLAVAFAIAIVNVGATVLLLVLANPRGVNWWSIFGTSLDDDPFSTYPTNPQVRALRCCAGAGAAELRGRCCAARALLCLPTHQRCSHLT